MAALQKFLHNFGATLIVYFSVALAIFEYIVNTKLIDIVHFNFALLSVDNRGILV